MFKTVKCSKKLFKIMFKMSNVRKVVQKMFKNSYILGVLFANNKYHEE